MGNHGMSNAYVVLDLEWNQGWRRGVQCSELLQIGAVGLDEHFQVTGVFNSYLRPVHLRRLNNKILRLTGADAAEVKAADDFTTVWPRFSEWCGDALLLAWGPSDELMLRRNLALYGLSDQTLRPFYNVQLAYIAAAGLTQEPSLASAVEALGLEDSLAYHDAANDARYTAQIARVLAECAGGKLPDQATVQGRLSDIVAERQAEKREAVSAELTELTASAAVIDERKLRGYVSEENCCSSIRARRVTCPVCGWSTGVNALYPYAPQSYFARARCPEHGPLYLTVSVRQQPSGRFGGVCRQLAPSDGLEQAYRTARGCIPAAALRHSRRHSRRRRRKRSA